MYSERRVHIYESFGKNKAHSTFKTKDCEAFDEMIEASEGAGYISDTEEMVETDGYVEAVAGQLTKVGEFFDKEMDVTNSASSIFNIEEMIDNDEYFKAAGPIIRRCVLYRDGSYKSNKVFLISKI